MGRQRRISLYYVASPIRPLKPREMLRTIALTSFAAFVAALTVSLAPPAHAQLGNIFGDHPPRPPAGVPRDDGRSPADEEEEVPDLPQQGRVLPTPNRPPPPPGASAVGARPNAGQPPPPPPVQPRRHSRASRSQPPQPARRSRRANAPPGQRPPRTTSGQGRAAAPATLQPGDEVVTEPPAQKITNKQAVFSGLDKITGRIISFDVDINETVQFGALRVSPRVCYTRPATENANTDAFVEVEEITLQGEVTKDLFRLDVCGKPRPARRRASDL